MSGEGWGVRGEKEEGVVVGCKLAKHCFVVFCFVMLCFTILNKGRGFTVVTV
jgi:hypothetical protein